MAPPPTSLVWLFDVDGTLLLTKGAGREAISAALRDRFGVDDDLTTIPFAGRTDALILSDVLQRHGLELVDGDRERFWGRVSEHMRVLMDPPRGGLLPGVRELLGTIADEPAWVCALLTGNVSEMARIKLQAFGVFDHFAWGAFGDEGPDRNAIARLAVRRAVERNGVPADRCIVVGDTEHDVECARAAGARSVAVATGSTPRGRLEAEGPDLVLDDLTEPRRLLEWAQRLA
jgi:phosphoglycolate phosphatase-like HAD superfamily hydrolase